MWAYEVCKEILFMSDDLTLLYSPEWISRSYIFLGVGTCFYGTDRSFVKAFKGFAINNLHYTSDPISFQSIKIQNS